MDIKISGIVVKGDGYGRKLGFPTVNLETTEALPPYGVYAGGAEIMFNTECRTFRAGILINPTGKIEAHLLGYAGDAYGKAVTLTLEKFLRDYKKFDTEQELITQIEKDLQEC